MKSKRSIVLSHKNRRDLIYVFTVDPGLGLDVQERIAFDHRTSGCEVVLPEGDGISAAVAEIERAAPRTVSARVIVFDVRSYTLPRLLHAYNKIVGYNRMDLNEACYSIVIGDGPSNLFQAGRSMEVFTDHLRKHRQDYHPAVFFYDPFMHYTIAEKQTLELDRIEYLPKNVPES